ncbi:nuclear transport factor 2 family protein [Phenylobacterium sp. J426]|uniref:nuclear transport factor 2 family protein n=1 Tax=Phenylobacterium sp. J426 TaxID=2898439 RepID=UPI0035AFE4AB
MVVAYASALDDRDWALMRSLLMDPVEIDYSSMGSIRGDDRSRRLVEAVGHPQGLRRHSARRHQLPGRGPGR